MRGMVVHHLQSLQSTWPSPCGHMVRGLVTWSGPAADLIGQDVLLDGEPRHVIEAVTISGEGADVVGLTAR